jgi:hypothetical protein
LHFHSEPVRQSRDDRVFSGSKRPQAFPRHAVRRFPAKRFFFNESVSVSSATPCFSSAPTAIADIAIAANGAAQTLAGSKGGAPMDATSKARRAGSTTATVSGITGGGAVKDRPA